MTKIVLILILTFILVLSLSLTTTTSVIIIMSLPLPVGVKGRDISESVSVINPLKIVLSNDGWTFDRIE